MKSGTITTLLFLLATTLSTRGQESSPPFQFSWPRETVLLTMGISGHLLGDYRLKRMTPAGPDDLRTSELPPWDRFAAGWYNPSASTASEFLVISVGGAMIYADVWERVRGHATWRPLLEDGLILGEALIWNSAFNLNVRALRIHPRPFVYASTNGSSSGTRNAPEAAGSFYSGHASAAFLGAAYFATVYPLRHPDFQYPGWLWAGSLTAASSVAILRVAAGKHFPSDVVAGAAMGTLLGWGFARIHQRDKASSRTTWIFDALPQPGGFAIQAARPVAAW